MASLRFASQCEHHMLPFFGEARVLFVTAPAAAQLVPGTLEALLDACSHRLQIQERLTQELASAVHAATGAPVPCSSQCVPCRLPAVIRDRVLASAPAAARVTVCVGPWQALRPHWWCARQCTCAWLRAALKSMPARPSPAPRGEPAALMASCAPSCSRC